MKRVKAVTKQRAQIMEEMEKLLVWMNENQIVGKKLVLLCTIK